MDNKELQDKIQNLLAGRHGLGVESAFYDAESIMTLIQDYIKPVVSEDEGMVLTYEEQIVINEPCLDNRTCPFGVATKPSYEAEPACDNCKTECLLKAQLSKVLSIVRAKVEKQENPFRKSTESYEENVYNNIAFEGYERCRQDTLKLLGGK